MYNNRFADTSKVKNILDDVLKYCEEVIYPKGTLMYRARQINDLNLNGPDFYGYNNLQSMAPPIDKTTSGRLNCSKIPILYLAEDKYTALAEVRPGKKSKVSISTIKLDKEIRVLKFNFFEKTNIADRDISSVLSDIKLDLYVPIMENEKEKYLSTQFLASYIKEKGYDGLTYSSAQSNKGNNVGLFDVNIGHAIDSKVYILQSVLFYAEEISPRETEEFLIPTSIKDKYSMKQIQEFLNKSKEIEWQIDD